MKKYLIIGNSAAAISAVEAIRSLDAKGSITLISDEPYHTYSRPLIAEYLSGEMDEHQITYRADDWYEQKNVDALLGVKVTKIGDGEVVAGRKKIPFDRLLISTGGTPFVPPMAGVDKKGVFSFTTLDDAKKIIGYKKELKKAVVIGGGLIGSKATEHLVHRGVEVTMVELADSILSLVLDPAAAELISERFIANGVNILTQETVKSINGKEEVTGVTLASGEKIKTDIVVVAVGVRPNIALTKKTEIKTNRGIVVNDQMQTSVKNIYAAGDVAEATEILDGGKMVIPIWPAAISQGRVAGINMAGGKADYSGSLSMNALQFFGLPIISHGWVRPKGEFEELSASNKKKGVYRKVIISDGKMIGDVHVGDVDRAGIFGRLVREKVEVESFKEKLVSDDFGLLDLPPAFRERM